MNHPADSHLKPTRILDYTSSQVQQIVGELDTPDQSPLDYLRRCHRYLGAHVAPIYTVKESQPTSVTLVRRKGSCSQRFACLESLARARGIPTCVRGLWIAGEFWKPRFKWSRPFIPSRILLAWPQFHLDGAWLSVEQLFGSLETLARNNPSAFANNSEALFDAISHTAVDFHGVTRGCGQAQCDLSRFAMEDAGLFATRDELFQAYPAFERTLRGMAFEIIFGGRKSR